MIELLHLQRLGLDFEGDLPMPGELQQVRHVQQRIRIVGRLGGALDQLRAQRDEILTGHRHPEETGEAEEWRGRRGVGPHGAFLIRVMAASPSATVACSRASTSLVVVR